MIAVEYINKSEQTNSFSEDQIEAFKNFAVLVGAKNDYKSSAVGIRNSTQTAIKILKNPCN